jgi:hypothetical protein
VASRSANVDELRTNDACVSDGAWEAWGDKLRTLPFEPSAAIPFWPNPPKAETHWPWVEPSAQSRPCGRDEKSSEIPAAGTAVVGAVLGAVVDVVSCRRAEADTEANVADLGAGVVGVVVEDVAGPATVVVGAGTAVVATATVDVVVEITRRGALGVVAWARPAVLERNKAAPTATATTTAAACDASAP